VKKENQKDIVSSFQKAAPYLNIVYTFFGSIIILGYVGFLLDDYFQKRPIFLISGVFLGFILGFYNLIKMVNQLEKKDGSQ